MRRTLLVVLVGAIAFVAALLVTVFLLWPSAPGKRPVLADNPPLKAATRTSVGIAPNLTGQANIGDANLSVVGVRINVAREVKPLLDRSVNEQMAALQARVRNDPSIEVVARREWAKMCRAIPLGRAAPGVPDLWLEVRPTRAF